jgi:CheY-like chemotaxis protein
MAKTANILIADPDLEAAKALSVAFRQRGYQVFHAPDGSKALELSVLRAPDVVLFDDQCQLLEVRTFIRILKTNPRTEDIPVVVTTVQLDVDRAGGARDGYLRKPFNMDEVLARVDHLLRKSEAAKNLRGEANQIEGNLAQLSLPDLLQILSMNKRTGRLNLVKADAKGAIHVSEGRPVNAALGGTEGEKALFRMLSWTEGSFSFVPNAVSVAVRINRSMEDALLEGLRQRDEVERLLPMLPPLATRLQLSAHGSFPPDQHPVTAQVMELLHASRTLGELLDLSPATDLDVLNVVSTLLKKGLAQKAAVQQSEDVPLLAPAEVHALRGRLSRGRSLPDQAVAKIFVCTSSTGLMRQWAKGLPPLRQSRSDANPGKSHFGTLGRLALAESLELDFFLLPPFEAARPLWRPFAAGGVGVFLLDRDVEAVRLAAFLAWEGRLPVVIQGDTVPEALREAPGGAFAVTEGPLAALRKLLIEALATTVASEWAPAA